MVGWVPRDTEGEPVVAPTFPCEKPWDPLAPVRFVAPTSCPGKFPVEVLWKTVRPVGITGMSFPVELPV